VFRLLETVDEKPTDLTGECVFHWIQKEKPDAVAIDETGLSAERRRSRPQSRIQSEQRLSWWWVQRRCEPIDEKMYYNWCAEIWGKAKQWLARFIREGS
jgi:hypothetical protein